MTRSPLVSDPTPSLFAPPAAELADYHLSHAALADLLLRLGRPAEKAAAYRSALALARQKPERRSIERRPRALEWR